MEKKLDFTTKKMTIAGKTAIFQNKTKEVPFYHTEFDGKIFTPALSEETGPTYLAGTFETRADDVFLAAYPKSGTHWLTYITNHIVENATIQNKEEYSAVIGSIPFLERTLPAQLQAAQSPRYMYTHLPYHLIPRSNEHQVKYIVIARNPRDVAVSQFNFVVNMKIVDFNGSWDEFLALFMRGSGFGGSYFDWVLEWWKHREDSNVLFLKYEDLKKNLTHEIGKISDFLGYTLSPQRLEQIAEQCTFQSMKENRVGGIEENKTLLMKDEAASFYRKGIVGDWINYFSNPQLEDFNRWCESHLAGTDLKFDFG